MPLAGRIWNFSLIKDTPWCRLHDRAYGRIWAGKFNFIWWGMIWCAAAAYFGFWLYDFVPQKIEDLAFRVGLFGFLGITPLAVGWASLRAYVLEGTGDSSLKTVPLRPWLVLLPRMSAVFLTWLELALPFVLLYIFNFVSQNRAMAHLNSVLPARFAVPDIGVTNALHLLTVGGNLGGVRVIPSSGVGLSEIPVLYLFLLLEVLGYGLLPISWAFWWGTILKRRGGPFLLAFFSYFLLVGLLVVIVRFDILGVLLGVPGMLLPPIILVSFGGITLSVLFTILAFREWRRRSG